MYDSVNAAAIPADAQLVAGYVDGRYAWTAADWARFPHAVHVPIAVFPTTNAGVMLDCENGDATPTQCPGWVRMRRAAGVDPTVYCSYSAWPTVRAAFAAAGEPPPHYLIAGYPDPVGPDGKPIVPAGAIGHQWIDRGPYDESLVADYWPGVDPAPAPPLEEDDMAPKAVIYRAQGAAGAAPKFPNGVLRDEFGVYVGLTSANEATDLTAALGAVECWVEEDTLAELVRISRVGVDTPAPTAPGSSTPPPAGAAPAFDIHLSGTAAPAAPATT
jgi:hypothetical protein